MRRRNQETYPPGRHYRHYRASWWSLVRQSPVRCSEQGNPMTCTVAADGVGINGPCREPFKSTPMAGGGSIRFRLALHTYAPWGCIIRVVSRTKSRQTPTRKTSPLFFHDQARSRRRAGYRSRRASSTTRPGTRRGPFNSTPMGVKSISPGPPRVRCTPMRRTCGA